MNWLELITALASLATAIGVLLAWWQIRLAKQQATTQFEDNIVREYREIALRLPVKALLEEQLDDAEYLQELENFYHYIDLTNEQIFLRQQNRINVKTWENWRDGIKSNLAKPAFKRAWDEIKLRAPDSFEELRRLELVDFKTDPVKWH
jgi:hypothetical protein